MMKLLAKKALPVALLTALAGCVAVPVDPYYGPAYAPAPVVVQPYYYGHYGYYRGGHRHWR